MKKKIYAALAFALYATLFMHSKYMSFPLRRKRKLYIRDTSRWVAVTRPAEIFP